jgi:hypothetical protein
MKHVMAGAVGIAMIAAIGFSGSAFAGSTDDPVIQDRMQRQQERINQGVSSGQLTPHETARLEAQQAKIQQDEMRARSDGVITAAEKRKLTREQNRANKDIYRKKHNDRAVSVNH